MEIHKTVEQGEHSANVFRGLGLIIGLILICITTSCACRDLSELLGSPEHRKLIQDELSSGDWYIPDSSGHKGPRGDKGPQGPVESRGPKGDHGLQGIFGDQLGLTVHVRRDRPWGPADHVNPQAAPSVPEYLAVRDHSEAQGDLGEHGPQDLVDPLGPKSDRGLQGIPGPQGDLGERGLKGDRGLVGSQGPQGIQGTSGQDGTLPIWELCVALALTLLGLYLVKSLIDLSVRKYRHKHGSIHFQYSKGAWS